MIYTNIYNILEQYVFGTIPQGSYVELVAILASTFFSIGAIALPIVALFKLFYGILSR